VTLFAWLASFVISRRISLAPGAGALLAAFRRAA